MINEQELKKVVDSTKLTTYMTCPRKFLYRHVLHWELDQPSVHLVFGQAWHLALEYMLLGLREGKAYPETVVEAKRLFHDHLVENYQDEHPIKNSDKGCNALDVYSRLFEGDLQRYEVLYTEVPGLVNIPGFEYYYKIDAILRDKEDGLIYVVDHKTAQTDSESWRAQWRLSPQVCAYMHTLYSLYDPGEVGGLIINVAFLRKASLDFDRIRLDIGSQHMQRWMAMVTSWSNHLQDDYQLLSTEVAMQQDRPDDRSLKAFPGNWTNCTKYGLCPYYDLCISWHDPTKQERPPGFRYEPWDPRQHSQPLGKDNTNDGDQY